MDEKIIKFLKKRHILSLSVACDASLLDFSDPAFSIAGLSDLGTDDTAATNATNAANAENAENIAATMGASSTANAANTAATMGASSTAAAANAENTAATMGAFSTANAANAANAAQIAMHTCSCFYAYCEPLNALVIASKPDTAHIKIALQNPQISLNIALDAKIIGRIEGIQARADFIQVTKLSADEQKLCKRAYFVRFPYALALNPKLYALKLSWLKYTNNALKNKLIWQK